MRCPDCEQRIHRTATGCPHCGYSLSDSDRIFGEVEVKSGRLGDEAGLLRRRERKRVEKEIRRFGMKFPQLFFAVRTVSLEEPVNLRQFGFWLLNRAEFGDLDQGLGNDSGVLLVIEAESRKASLTYGYRVEPFLGEIDTFKCLSKAHPYLLEGDWHRGIVTVARNVDKVLRRRWWQALIGRGRFEPRDGTRRRTGDLDRRIQFGPDGESPVNEAKA